MKNYIDIEQKGRFRFTEQMRRAIAHADGADDGRLATERECAAWLAGEVNSLVSELIATHGTKEERDRCRRIRRRLKWARHRSRKRETVG